MSSGQRSSCRNGSRRCRWPCLTGPLTGYAFAWLGHFGFEKNKPATFRHPVWSLMGDFVMAAQILRGRIRW
jgi:hypothetical protein